MIGGNLSLVFPGQGSQKPKMLSIFFENSKFKDTFKEASSKQFRLYCKQVINNAKCLADEFIKLESISLRLLIIL